MPNGMPQPNEVDMTVIQAAIDRRRNLKEGGPMPAGEQVTGAAGPPGVGAPPAPSGEPIPEGVMAQRAAPPTEGAQKGTKEESPEEKDRGG